MSSVFVTQELFDEEVAAAGEPGAEIAYRADPEPLSGEQLREALAGHEGVVTLLTDRVDAAVLDANPQLRVVSNVAVGFDNIDVAAATERGVLVTNTPGVLTAATADLAMALLLAAARRVPEGDAFLREGRWRRWRVQQEQLGVDVTGQTLGIVGLGKIGQAVARRARLGFNMEVCYHNPSRLPLEDEAELGVTYAAFDELLARSDFVSLHAPLTDATRHLFDADAFAAMKPTAILVNTARGPVVDEAALVDALAAGDIAGAGLDVYEREPEVDPRLPELRERVVLLPHLGSATERTRRRMVTMALADAVAGVAGRRPANLVNPSLLD